MSLQSDTLKTGPDQTADFNEAINYLWRVGQTLMYLDIAQFNDNIPEHFRLLRVLFKELVQQMNDKQTKYHILRYETLLSHYRKYIIDKSPTIDMMEFLDTWEIELRKFHQESGGGMPKARDPRFSLARGRG